MLKKTPAQQRSTTFYDAVDSFFNISVNIVLGVTKSVAKLIGSMFNY